jgi:hypothetical protein
MRKSRYLMIQHGRCNVIYVCQIALLCFYPVSQSADVSLCTSRIRSLRLLSHCSGSSFHLQIKQLCDELLSCEPSEMVQFGGGSGYCISAGTAGISYTTHGPPNMLVLVLENSCASLVTHCHDCVSHELHCCLLGDINGEALSVPVRCVSVSNSVVQISSRGCDTGEFFTVFWSSLVGHSLLAVVNFIRPESFPKVFLQFTFL